MSEKDETDEAEASDRDGERESEPDARAADDADAADAADADDADADEPRAESTSRSRKLAKKARREEAARAAKKDAMTRAIVVGLIALAAGGAAGWFGHIAQAKAKIRKESVPATAGSAGPCGAWETKICTSSGKESAACMQAKGATGLLTPGTCEVALETVPATLAKVKAERVPCDTLTQKLCKDVPPDSKGCALVKEKTPMFPVDRCKEMLANYDQVLAEVKRIDQSPMGMPGHGADDGHGH
jgi:hypothetical protein